MGRFTADEADFSSGALGAVSNFEELESGEYVGWRRSAAALELIARLPLPEVGCLYLDSNGRPVRPDPATPEFPTFTRHFGSVRGAWPRVAQT